jgi:predicted amidohydrolase
LRQSSSNEQYVVFDDIFTTLDEGNLVGLYDKIHLCQFGACREKEFFKNGDVDQVNHVFDCYGFKCGNDSF